MGSGPGPSLPEPRAPLHTGWRRGGESREAGQGTSSLDPRDSGRALTSWRAARLRKSQHCVARAYNTPSKLRRKASLGSRARPSRTPRGQDWETANLCKGSERGVCLKSLGAGTGVWDPSIFKGYRERNGVCVSVIAALGKLRLEGGDPVLKQNGSGSMHFKEKFRISKQNSRLNQGWGGGSGVLALT